MASVHNRLIVATTSPPPRLPSIPGQPLLVLVLSYNQLRYYQMLSCMLTRAIRLSSRIKTAEVLAKSYDQLVTLVAKKYGNQQFRHPNAAALYQIQHHFRVISPGDCVLDIGAGPQFRWTELALGLTQDEQNSHRVVSNDKIECRVPRPDHIYIQGDFTEEQTRTRIGLALQQRKFNTILCDVSPEFSGEVDEDAQAIFKVIQEALMFSSLFLHKGGNLVCKMLQSHHCNLLEESGKILFHEAYSYRPSVLRQRSPVKFLIFKGYSINHNLQALREFYSRYRGSPKNKLEVVNAYKDKYSWDPVDMIRRKAKNDILQLKMMGRGEREIEGMFQNDPFVNIAEIMKQVRMLDKAKKDGDQLQVQKAIYAFTDKKLYKEATQIPVTREEWITYIQKMQAKLKQSKMKGKPKQNFEPLGDNEVYMRNENVAEEEQKEIIYIEQDLLGEYDLQYETQYIEREIQKFGDLFVKTKDRLDKGQQFELGKNIHLSDVFTKKYGKQEQVQPLSEMAEDLKLMTNQQFKKMADEEGYDEEIEQSMSKSVRGSRNKFKNR